MKALSSHVACLRLRAPRGFVWQPGQHIELSTTERPESGTPYSIASHPNPQAPGEFDLTVSTRYGADWLDLLSEGVGLLVSEARGQFIWRPEADSTLLVGMGTAVAPLRAMLHAALAQRVDSPITLLLGARTEPDILFREELWGLSRKHPRFQFEPTLSRPGKYWGGLRGRVQQHLLRLVHAHTPKTAYICGSSEMVQDVLDQLRESSPLSLERIHSEMG